MKLFIPISILITALLIQLKQPFVMFSGLSYPDIRWVIDMRCFIQYIFAWFVQSPAFDVAIVSGLIHIRNAVEHTMSSGKKLSILNNHFHTMLITMLGGTSAGVVAEIEDIHRVFGSDPSISPFQCFRNLWELDLKDFLTCLSNLHVLLLCAVGRAKVDVVYP